MLLLLRRAKFVIAAIVVFLAVGCSWLGPKTGTRITFAFPKGGHVRRERLAELSRYLIMRCSGVLDVHNARVESVTNDSLVLLLPGKRVSAADAAKLLKGTGLEFYHLKKVATEAHPDRLWQMRLPTRASGSYIFLGPSATRIDSQLHKELLLKEVVGRPVEKPVLDGDDVLPNAAVRETGRGWAVNVRFNRNGTKTLRDFTRANRGEYLAIFYNGELISAPIIQDPIENGEAYITGFRTRADAEIAVSRLNSGVLPEAIRIKSVRTF